MQNIKILSPLHIGNGLKYANYVINDNKKYEFEKILELAFKKNKSTLLSNEFLRVLSTTNASASGDAKRQLAELFTPSAKELEGIDFEYNVKLACPKINQLDIYENIKTNSKLMIPGSSLKGYIMNVIMFDVIKNNSEIRNWYKQNIFNTKSVEMEVFPLCNQKLICRDIIFEENPVILLISRITKTRPIRIIYECLPKEIDKQADFIIINEFALNQETRFNNNISNLLYNEISKRIENIKKLFSQMNKAFILNALKYEEEFIKNVQYNKEYFDKQAVLTQIDNLRTMLENNKIIMQLGKNTNYITKSVGHAFDSTFYRENFYSYFNPGQKPSKYKKIPIAKPFVIGSMNIVSSAEYENYEEIPGFVEIEWL